MQNERFTRITDICTLFLCWKSNSYKEVFRRRFIAPNPKGNGERVGRGTGVAEGNLRLWPSNFFSYFSTTNVKKPCWCRSVDEFTTYTIVLHHLIKWFSDTYPYWCRSVERFRGFVFILCKGVHILYYAHTRTLVVNKNVRTHTFQKVWKTATLLHQRLYLSECQFIKWCTCWCT